MRGIIGAIVLLAAPLASPPALAQQMRGGWETFETVGACGIRKRLPGRAAIFSLERRPGELAFSITGENMTGRPPLDPLRLRIDDRSFAVRPFVNPELFGGRLDADFPAAFAAGRRLSIVRGAEQLGRLSLDGSAAALAALRRCVTARLAGMPEQERRTAVAADQLAGLMPLPAASEPARRLSGSISGGDFLADPHASEGIVAARFLIGVDGRVAHCQVTRSSGRQSLDTQTCSLIVRRFRYQPARDGGGRLVPSAGTLTVAWTSADDEPAPAPPPKH